MIGPPPSIYYRVRTAMADRIRGVRGLPKGGSVQTPLYGLGKTGPVGKSPYPVGTGGVGTGMGSHSFLKTASGSPVMVNTKYGSTHFGWFTGTVTRNDYIDVISKFSSITGMDNRNAAGTLGKISLVSPILVWAYDDAPALGGVTRLRDGFGGVARIHMNFIPEPSRLALLGWGMLGLLARYRLSALSNGTKRLPRRCADRRRPAAPGSGCCSDRRPAPCSCR